MFSGRGVGSLDEADAVRAMPRTNAPSQSNPTKKRKGPSDNPLFWSERPSTTFRGI